MEVSKIKKLIKIGLPDATIEIYSDDGQHFNAKVISPSFLGKTLIQQHRMIYNTLGDSFKNSLHALSLRTSAK
ncbi:MAG: BolA family transcriptional regulator [Piscirickettsiaceae bacterium]|nr:BolA family transcriptional regulator [Piscirickettsiaceae bacterium]